MNKIRKPNIQKMKRVLARGTHDLGYYRLVVGRDDMLNADTRWAVSEVKEVLRGQVWWWEKRMKVKYVNPDIQISFYNDFNIDFNMYRFSIEGRVIPGAPLRRYHP